MMKKPFCPASFGFHLLCLLLLSLLWGNGCKQKEEAAETKPPQDETAPKVSASATSDTHNGEGPQTGKHDLRILYAGHPGATQEKEFFRFLNKHFVDVATTDLKAFREDQSDGFDVTILAYDGDGFKAPRPRLSYSFSRPLLTVGVPGAWICQSLGLKMAYL